MAKKKVQKQTKKKKTGYHIEIIGLIYIIIAIIGYGPYGVIGKLITSFSAFLVGTWYYVFLVFVLILGAYMIVKRERPNFFSTRFLGFYIIVIAILTFSHINYVKQTNFRSFEIISSTVSNFMSSTYNMENIQGGGIIGSFFTWLFVLMFDTEGTVIVSWALLICGIIIFTNITITDFFKKIKTIILKIIHGFKKSKHQEEIKKVEQDYEKDKVIITSVEELINVSDKEELKENIKTEIKEEVNSEDYTYPSIDLLEPSLNAGNINDKDEVNKNIKLLEQVMKDFLIEAKVVAVNIGPAVTQYELELKAGTKVSKVLGINREIALVLAAKNVRIQAPIPGKNTIGIEIPNKVTATIMLREILEAVPKKLKNNKLLVTLGKDIVNKPIFFEINKAPHLLVAGATGSGKSVCINSIIISLLMRCKPEEVKLVLIDPKKVELSMYNGIPHLLAPVVTDSKKANIVLKKIVVEMDKRYDLFSEAGTKNIAGYNKYIEKKNKTLSEKDKIKKMPYIITIIDELADLMLVAAKEVEDSIMRITQMARATGIHLIVATQRPSTDVITGLIKSNIPSRISFAVSSGIDSRTILDMSGAEKLLGRGDMLFLPMGESTPIRIQGTFISEEEIKRVVKHTISEQIAKYDETLLMDDEELKATTMLDDDAFEEPMYNEIVEFIVEAGKASTSMIQRHFRFGYNRAARVMDLLEDRGIIGPPNGPRAREVLYKLEDKEKIE